MKKRIAGMVALTIVMFTTTFAKNTDDNINAKALTTFTEKFADVKEVKWSKADNYYKATFKMNDQVLTAFISEAGEWMGVVRNLLSYQLPINLQTDLKKNYSQYWISELFEFATDGETVYYAIVENADQKISLKTSGQMDWSSIRKEKKN
jgi:hypothetical protein